MASHWAPAAAPVGPSYGRRAAPAGSQAQYYDGMTPSGRPPRPDSGQTDPAAYSSYGRGGDVAYGQPAHSARAMAPPGGSSSFNPFQHEGQGPPEDPGRRQRAPPGRAPAGPPPHGHDAGLGQRPAPPLTSRPSSTRGPQPAIVTGSSGSALGRSHRHASTQGAYRPTPPPSVSHYDATPRSYAPPATSGVSVCGPSSGPGATYTAPCAPTGGGQLSDRPPSARDRLFGPGGPGFRGNRAAVTFPSETAYQHERRLQSRDGRPPPSRRRAGAGDGGPSAAAHRHPSAHLPDTLDAVAGGGWAQSADSMRGRPPLPPQHPHPPAHGMPPGGQPSRSSRPPSAGSHGSGEHARVAARAVVGADGPTPPSSRRSAVRVAAPPGGRSSIAFG